nr:Proteasome activator complex subunit 4 [Hymenolepis microstoma]
MSRKIEENYMEISRVLPLLPYANQLDSYAEIAGIGLKESLRRLLSSSTYSSHHLRFPYYICNYIQHFGMRFTKKEVIDLIHFGLSLVFCQQVDGNVREGWMTVTVLLLRLSINFIGRKELQLNWKEFFVGFTRYNNELDYCDKAIMLSNRSRELLSLAKTYFPASCVEEIWQHCRPLIYTDLVRLRFDRIFSILLDFTPNRLEHFEEIKRVWLDEIIHIWYQHNDPKVHVAVVNLLAKFAHHFPGRLDMDLHLDRIFSFLVAFYLGHIECDNVVYSSAKIIANSLAPDSDVLKLLRHFFHFCQNTCHISSKSAMREYFPVFCCELIKAVFRRLQRELHYIADMKEHLDEIVDWARLTKEQVDEFVEIVLPTCLEVNIYTQDSPQILNAACDAVRYLACLRPRLVFTALIEDIEEGFSSPQLPLRVTRPLMALSSSIKAFFTPSVTPAWSHYIGFQPTDQLHNYSTNDSFIAQISVEQRKQWASHLSAVIFPEGRTLIPRILNICLAALDLNQRDRLDSSLNILRVIFLATPIKDCSDRNHPSTKRNFLNGDESLMHEVIKRFHATNLVHFSPGMEDIVVEIYKKIFYFMEKENESSDFQFSTNESVQMSTSATMVKSATIMNFLASSSSVSPGLRARLVTLCLNTIMQNQWTLVCVEPLFKVLFSLLCVSPTEINAVSNDDPESDIALFALKQFWTRFTSFYDELKSDSAIIYKDKVEPRIITSLFLIRIFVHAFVPARLKEVKTYFINPVIEVLSDLLTISLGSGDESPPSIALACYASECLSDLLHRLVTFSLDFRGVDLYNSSGFATDPLWTPFVSYRKANDYVKWISPTEETFNLAKSVLIRLFLPLLNKLSAVTDELNAFLVSSDTNNSNFPQIPLTSGQSKVVYQRAYLMSLTTWIAQVSRSLLEGLKPRDIHHEDVNYVNEICSELELLRHEAVSCPVSSLAASSIHLDIPFFDLPSEEDGSSLRDQIFRCGLRFLDAMAELSVKFDAQTFDTAAQSGGQSVIGNLYSLLSIQHFLAVISIIGFNSTDYSLEPENLHFTIHIQSKTTNHSLNSYFDYLEPEHIKNSAIRGPSSELLSVLVAGKIPTLRCGGVGGNYGISYLPIVWIMCAQRQHLNFVCRTLGRHATWPGTEATALFTYPKLPVNQELIKCLETSMRLSLNCLRENAHQMLALAYGVATDELLGSDALLARKLIEILEPFYTEDVYIKSDAEYRACYCRLIRGFAIIDHLLFKTSFAVNLYSHDPALWSDLWTRLLKLCLFTDINNMQLTDTQIRERINDQTAISRFMNVLAENLVQPTILYFHSNYDPNAHPKDASLRRLILSAQRLLKTLSVGSEEEMVMYKPPLLAKTAKLRRNAYRCLIHSIDQNSPQDIDENANSIALMVHLTYVNFHTDAWDTLSNYVTTPDTLPFRKTAPPPPSPRLSTVKNVLRLISSQNIDLAFTAASFITKFLSHFLLRTRNQDFVWVDPRAFKWSNTCVGSENEPQYDCLAAQNFNLENSLLDHLKSPTYFSPPFLMRNPCSHAVFPVISDTIGNGFKVDPSNEEWFKVRPEMDLSELSPEDLLNWREGLTTVAEFFASPDFWTQMSHVVLNYHQRKIQTSTVTLKQLIYMVLVCFGPHPYLQRVEGFLMSLLQPALTQGCTSDKSKYIGTCIANGILNYFAQSSHYWPREMRLQVYGRVLPRLIAYSEAAAQLASIDYSHEPYLALGDNLPLFSPDLVGENIDDVSTLIETESSSEGDQLVKRIYCDNFHEEKGFKLKADDFIKFSDPYGPKRRITLTPKTFLTDNCFDVLLPVYSSYIWKFFCELASDDSKKAISQKGEVGCGHSVPDGDGECPVCVVHRLFTRPDQRLALKYQFIEAWSSSDLWNVLHLLKHFTDADAIGLWEEKLYSNSHWARTFACRMSLLLSEAGFNRFLNSAPPKIRLFSGVERPVWSEHQVSSALETELLSRLSAFDAPGLRRLALYGPDFLMKRFLPLVVRDWMAVLLLRGFCPSSASFVLQENLLFDATERLTPATEELLHCSQRAKFFVRKQIALRLCFLMNFLVHNIWSTFPMNVSPNSSSESAFDVFYRLVPLLADHVATIGSFVIDGRLIKDVHTSDTLDYTIIDLIKMLGKIATMGHTDTGIGINRSNRILDFFEVFLRHSEWKTRYIGLYCMDTLVLNISNFWVADEAGTALRTRLKRRLCELLADPWIDVARAASSIISKYLILSVIEYDDLWFRELTKQSRMKLPTLQKKLGEITKEEKVKALQCRRAGVLGLCSIVQANPHDTPDYLPAVIAEVANHANDPHPISKFVSETLMEYSRSHIDRWLVRDREKFTEDQLDAYLSVVSGVNYYV